jgi:hypothetical protein
VLIIAILAVIGLTLIPNQRKEIRAGEGSPALAFFGTAVCGRTVTACREPNFDHCGQAVADSDNMYYMDLPPNSAWLGLYTIDDGQSCTPHFNVPWLDPRFPSRADFCGDPDPNNCPCH